MAIEGKTSLSYHSQLERLFQEWREESLKYDEPREACENGRIIFTEDGLVEKLDSLGVDVEKEWRESEKRIMFILKDQPSEWCNDARLWLRQRPENRELKSRFIHNIANIFWGLYYADKEHPCTSAEMRESFDKIKECFNTKPFALVESKKQGGKTSISNTTLKEYLRRYGNFLKREMEILKPNMIVCTSAIIYSFVCECFLAKELIKIDDVHNSVRFHKKSGTLIFCSYHPSAPNKNYEEIYEGVMYHYRAFLNSDFSEK